MIVTPEQACQMAGEAIARGEAFYAEPMPGPGPLQYSAFTASRFPVLVGELVAEASRRNEG